MLRKLIISPKEKKYLREMVIASDIKGLPIECGFRYQWNEDGPMTITDKEKVEAIKKLYKNKRFLKKLKKLGFKQIYITAGSYHESNTLSINIHDFLEIDLKTIHLGKNWFDSFRVMPRGGLGLS